MSKIKSWHLYAASAVILGIIGVESFLEGKYILPAVDFLASVTCAYAAYSSRKYGD